MLRFGCDNITNIAMKRFVYIYISNKCLLKTRTACFTFCVFFSIYYNSFYSKTKSFNMFKHIKFSTFFNLNFHMNLNIKIWIRWCKICTRNIFTKHINKSVLKHTCYNNRKSKLIAAVFVAYFCRIIPS